MKNQERKNDTVKQAVRERYGRIAERSEGCGCAPSCCSPKEAPTSDLPDPAAVSPGLGYSPEETRAVPGGSNLGLGCGNPHAVAGLQAGETVLDLGSGAGFDAFLAAKAVGPTGSVIGVDMTSEMISKARQNQDKGPYDHVEFRLGEIESLPVADASVDVLSAAKALRLAREKSRIFNSSDLLSGKEKGKTG
jgi:SAM-dependent methyltransferase